MADHGAHAGHTLNWGRFNGHDTTSADCGVDDDSVELVGLIELDGIARAAGYLQGAVDTCDRLAENGRAHAFSPDISSTRVIVRGSKATLKPFPDRGRAPAVARSA